MSTPLSTPLDCSSAFNSCISCNKQALKGERREVREETREQLERPMLVRFFNGGDEVLLVHLSAHTSQNAINRNRHLLLLRCLLRIRCRLLWERLPLRRRLRLMLSCRRHAIFEMLASCVQHTSRMAMGIWDWHLPLARANQPLDYDDCRSVGPNRHKM